MATNLWQPFSLQLDAGGNGTAEVGAPALGFNWAAFITMGTAPAGQTFTVSVSGQVVASGGRQSGAFAAGSGQVVTVTVSGGTASSTVNGVVQGSINQGVAPSAPMPSSGSLIEVSGGVVDVTGSKVTIQAGQGGVNVSTDTPPQAASSNLTVAAGASTGTVTLTPPASATGFVLVTVPNGTSQPAFKATGQTSLNVYAAVDFGTAGSGTIVGVVEGAMEAITFEVSGYTNSSSNPETAAFIAWLFGSGVQQVVNEVTQPLYVQGPFSTYPTGELAKLDMIVGGSSGPSLYAVRTIPDPPQICQAFNVSLAAGATLTLIAGSGIELVRVRRFQVSTNGAAQVSLEDSNGSVLWIGQGAAAAIFPDLDFQGCALATGDGLVLKNAGTTTAIFNGRVTADQY